MEKNSKTITSKNVLKKENICLKKKSKYVRSKFVMEKKKKY